MPQTTSTSTGRTDLRIVLAACAIGAALLAIAFFGLRETLRDPGVYWLAASDGAEWIVYPEPPSMARRAEGGYGARFGAGFEIETAPAEAVLELRAFRTGRVWLDGQPIGGESPPLAAWQSTRQVDLAPLLTPGAHTLELEIENQNSYPALWARCEALGLATGESWWVELPRRGRTQAASAHRIHAPAPLADRFAPSHVAFARLWPMWLALLALVFLIDRGGPRGLDPLRGWRPDPGQIRWLLIGAVSLLGLNNLFRLPWSIGFDVVAHAQYIDFIIAKRALPLASDGWEMFQAPLYYLVSVPFALLFGSLGSDEAALSLLRVVPMACGVAHIEVSRRVMRAAFPEREDMQSFGLVCAALLPMNLLLSQTIGNESTSALLTGLTVLVAVRLLQDGALSPGRLGALGAVWGLALLAKSSALLLAPGLLAVVLHATLARRDDGPRPLASAAASVGLVFGAALLVAGWFYARNWIELGSPLHVGWDPEVGLAWWQDPGYRTSEQLLRFGAAIAQPINAVHYGFWDGFYSSLFADGYLSSRLLFEDRPPWNYTFMLAGALLALIPAALILVGALGALRVPRRAEDRIALLALFCLATYVAAMLYLALQIPNYSVTKASYTTGLASCYGLLAARGYAALGRTKGIRLTLVTGLVAWAICAWVSFLALGG